MSEIREITAEMRRFDGHRIGHTYNRCRGWADRLDAIALKSKPDLSKLRALLDSARAVPHFDKGEIEALIWEWQDTLSDFIKQQEGT